MHELFATKGVEYLLAIGYLLLLIPFWMGLHKSARQRHRVWVRDGLNLFGMPLEARFDPGHAWVTGAGRRLVRVGWDDFASKLVGRPDEVLLPAVGTTLSKGQTGWRVRVGDKEVAMRAPVSGEVVAVNSALADHPGKMASDPYGQGWLMELRVPGKRSALSALLGGERARAWLDEAARDLFAVDHGRLGLVLQDGGTPVAGIAKMIAGDDWVTLAARHFHTSPPKDVTD